MRRGSVRLAALAAGPLCVLALAAPAMAAGNPPLPGKLPAGLHAAAPRVAGKISPSARAGYFASSGSSSYNSSGGAVTMTNPSTGGYTVTFAGLGGITGGNVEISDQSTDTCVVGGWGPVGSDLTVNVFCYTYAGVLANAEFMLTVTQPIAAPHGALAYDWNYKTASSYTPVGAYQYNSAGKHNTIAHLGTGQYKVTMPGVATTGTNGTVKVSGYGLGGGDCQLLQWGATSAGEVAFVNCYAASGARQDRLFTIAYAKGNNIMGQNSLVTANALADQPAATAYIPRTQFDSVPGAKVSLAQYQQPHLWVALFAASSSTTSAGNIQVTPQGSSYAHCLVFNTGGGFTPIAEVGCVNGAGTAVVSSAYTLQYAATP
jgi:hypothetical protein